MQEFKISKKFIWKVKISFVAFVAFLAIVLSLPFLPENKDNLYGALIITVPCTIILGFFSILCWRILKKLPFVDIAVDDDGVWYMHLGKERGLIFWDEIYKIKERQVLQRLDLRGIDNQELLSVEYQLQGFEELRNILNERACPPNKGADPSSFTKGPLHHFFLFASVIAYSAVGFFAGKWGYPEFGYGAMSILVCLLIYEYLVTATGVKVASHSFKLTYPLSERSIPFNDIEDIVIADKFHKGNRYQEVWITTRNAKKPFKLKNIGADANLVYRTLKRAAKL